MCKHEIRRTFSIKEEIQLDWGKTLLDEEQLERLQRTPKRIEVFSCELVQVYGRDWKGQLRFPCVQLDRVRMAVLQHVQMYQHMKQEDAAKSANGDHQRRATTPVEFDSQLQGVHISGAVNFEPYRN